jgi:hypothetical protein
MNEVAARSGRTYVDGVEQCVEMDDGFERKVCPGGIPFVLEC